jgi:hypothetical protein
VNAMTKMSGSVWSEERNPDDDDSDLDELDMDLGAIKATYFAEVYE